ncbi:hypothetical protein [Pararhodobacter aggregans]|uniref:hypothetical protein n=1 Tax=Pararhodobacter aggregans TaxID=404875 RepID=UPI003A8FBD74
MMPPDPTALGPRLAATLAAGTLDTGALEALLTDARAAPLAMYPAPARRLRAVAGTLYQAGPMGEALTRAPDLAWLLIHSPNGFHRDAALLRLPPPVHPLDLAALLARLDDWVPAVRRLAETRLARHLPAIAPGIVAEVALARGDTLERARRITPAGRRLWQALLDRAPEALIQVLRTGQGRAVRQLFLRLMGDPAFDPALPMLLREAAHPSLRASALWWLVGGQVSYTAPQGPRWQGDHPVAGRRPLSVAPDVAQVMALGAVDRSSQVRKVAAEMLKAYGALDSQAAGALTRHLARDRNAGVRARAEWFLGPR